MEGRMQAAEVLLIIQIWIFQFFIKLNELFCRTQKPYLFQNTCSSAHTSIFLRLFD